MPQSSEPYKIVDSLATNVPGIAQEKIDPIYTNTEGSAAAHNLQNQPVLFDGSTYGTLNSLGAANYFDNVYMPQPKTRETDHPNNACSSNCYGPNDGSNPTYDDDYRFWPAKRDRDGGIVGAIYTSTINTGPGCARYESTDAKSSDEGAWNSTYGSNFAHTGHFLGSPAYNTVYYTTPDDNTFLNGSNFTTSNYITSFLAKFAKGYFTSCCTNTIVDAKFLRETPKEWGNFGTNNIRYGIEYYDDEAGGWGCNSYDDGGPNCCDGEQTCGGIFRPDSIAADAYVATTPSYYVGGIRAGHTTESKAGYGWLKSTETYSWTESDIYNTSEPTQASNNPPGKFGIVDTNRTQRHYNEVRCMQSVLGDNANPESPAGVEDLGGTPSTSERCTAGGLQLSSVPTWFVNEGKIYTSADYM